MSTTTRQPEPAPPAPEQPTRKKPDWPTCSHCGLSAVPPIIVNGRCANVGACTKRQRRGPRTLKRKVKQP